MPRVPPIRRRSRGNVFAVAGGADAGLGRWHGQRGINPWTAASRWRGDRLDLDWALWVLWGQHASETGRRAA